MVIQRAPKSPLLRAFGKTWMKPLTLLLLLLPAFFLLYEWILVTNDYENELGFEPERATHHFLGDTSIRILLATLLVSPVRDISGWAPIALIRRRVGVAAFFYSCAHLLAYLWFDLGWSMAKLADDFTKRAFITFGLLALALMLPLAVTSTNGMIRRLGRKLWERIHWLIFPAAILTVVHNFYAVKGLQNEPVIHAIILALLLGWRLYHWIRGKLQKPAEVAA